jgi:hypothetical protein
MLEQVCERHRGGADANACLCNCGGPATHILPVFTKPAGAYTSHNPAHQARPSAHVRTTYCGCTRRGGHRQVHTDRGVPQRVPTRCSKTGQACELNLLQRIVTTGVTGHTQTHTQGPIAHGKPPPGVPSQAQQSITGTCACREDSHQQQIHGNRTTTQHPGPSGGAACKGIATRPVGTSCRLRPYTHTQTARNKRADTHTHTHSTVILSRGRERPSARFTAKAALLPPQQHARAY